MQYECFFLFLHHAIIWVFCTILQYECFFSCTMNEKCTMIQYHFFSCTMLQYAAQYYSMNVFSCTMNETYTMHHDAIWIFFMNHATIWMFFSYTILLYGSIAQYYSMISFLAPCMKHAPWTMIQYDFFFLAPCYNMNDFFTPCCNMGLFHITTVRMFFLASWMKNAPCTMIQYDFFSCTMLQYEWFFS